MVTCSTPPYTSHHVDGETEAQRGDRAPNITDVVGGGDHSTMELNP